MIRDTPAQLSKGSRLDNIGAGHCYSCRLTRLSLPCESPASRHVYHVYSLVLRSAEPMYALAAKGIQAGVHYPTPVHLLPAYSDVSCRLGDFQTG
jgi:dTDP-4-amino-4,6-dideoxygalactose transaminase